MNFGVWCLVTLYLWYAVQFVGTTPVRSSCSLGEVIILSRLREATLSKLDDLAGILFYSSGKKFWK